LAINFNIEVTNFFVGQKTKKVLRKDLFLKDKKLNKKSLKKFKKSVDKVKTKW